MKKLITSLTVVATLVGAIAQPINYQGKLSDESGNPVNGTKNFSLSIFDDKTGGKSIYEESVGTVAVKDGLYSFNFGEKGGSVAKTTETVAVADGEKQIFNYIVKNKPILGEVKISGGGHSWTEAGSSSAGNFTATLNKQSGAISAIFLQKAPNQGEEIKIEYTYLDGGIMGALSRGSQAWLEITVSSETLSPRERLVAVPFALKASVADSVLNPPESVLYAERPEGYVTLVGSGESETFFYYLPDTGARSIKLYTKYTLHGEGLLWLKVKSLDNSFNKEVVKPAHNQGSSDPAYYKPDTIELESLPKSGFIVIEHGFRLKNPGDSLGMNIGPRALTIKY